MCRSSGPAARACGALPYRALRDPRIQSPKKPIYSGPISLIEPGLARAHINLCRCRLRQQTCHQRRLTGCLPAVLLRSSEIFSVYCAGRCHVSVKPACDRRLNPVVSSRRAVTKPRVYTWTRRRRRCWRACEPLSAAGLAPLVKLNGRIHRPCGRPSIHFGATMAARVQTRALTGGENYGGRLFPNEE
ncbi:hypothetical protein MRX96_005696 [Rhipicephalus microplus]